MHHRTRTQTFLVVATSMAVSWLASAAEAQSHRSNRAGARSHQGGHQATAVSTRPAHQPAPQPQVHRPPNHPRRPGVLSPGLGSAANVRPGFYQQLNVPRHHGRGGGHHGHGVPVYVYPTYYPEPFYTPAPVYAEPEPRQAPAPVQPQIYVVTPPVIAAPAPVSVAPVSVAPPPPPRSTAPGEIRFSVLPAGARVYLDDDYLGTGAELAALDAAALFPPGVHVLEVTHPDHRSQRLVFGVSDSDPAHVLIDLRVDRIGRRTRVK